MLTHSPPLPLIIYYPGRLAAGEDEDVLFALQHRDRVHRIHIRAPAASLPCLLNAMDGEYQVLQRLVIHSHTEKPCAASAGTGVQLPTKLQAPLLRRLTLTNVPRAHGAARAPRRTLPHRAPQPRRRADALGSSHDARGTPTPPATLLPRRQRVSRGHARAHQRPESHVRPALPRPLRPRGAALPRGGRRRDSEVPVPRCGAALRRRDRLRVSRRALDWQLASLAQICGALTPLFAHVEGLTLGLHTSRPKPDANSDCSDSDRAQWHALLRACSPETMGNLALAKMMRAVWQRSPLSERLRDALWVSSVIGGEVRSTVLVLLTLNANGRMTSHYESFLYSCSRCLLSDTPLYFYSITILRVSPAMYL
ncbi:hypothetical protein EDB84DRAFT_1494629 [Lactarius hengduanensis]|nr:hypothetical protein EDB84DRAFT_1494629 [Lactarius hengduanensis]